MYWFPQNESTNRRNYEVRELQAGNVLLLPVQMKPADSLLDVDRLHIGRSPDSEAQPGEFEFMIER